MSYDKPLPVLRGEERVYFDHARRHELVYQHCRTCGADIFYPRTVCPTCSGTDLDIQVASGRGTVYSYTTLYRPGHPAFADDVPYTVALIELEEGVRVMSDLVGIDEHEARIGMAVEVVFDAVTEDFTLPRFTPRRESTDRGR